MKRGGSLSLLLFNLAVEYVIRRLQANQEGLNLSGAHQLLVYTDVNILSESIHTKGCPIKSARFKVRAIVVPLGWRH